MARQLPLKKPRHDRGTRQKTDNNMQLRLKFAYWNVNGLDYQSAWAVEKAIKTEVSTFFFILLCLSITFTNPRLSNTTLLTNHNSSLGYSRKTHFLSQGPFGLIAFKIPIKHPHLHMPQLRYTIMTLSKKLLPI